MSWRMPAETEPQARVWMAFPTRSSYVADSPDVADRARTAWARVAHTIAEFEPLTMVVDPDEKDGAQRYLDEGKAEIVEAPLDDSWMRDIGPTFVVDESGQLGAVDWVFNGGASSRGRPGTRTRASEHSWPSAPGRRSRSPRWSTRAAPSTSTVSGRCS